MTAGEYHVSRKSLFLPVHLHKMASNSAKHKHIRTDRTRSRPQAAEGDRSRPNQTEHPDARRFATVYDAVAGRIGIRGFLGDEQRRSTATMASKPEEVLLRRVTAPEMIPFNYYNADENLGSNQRLPDSDLLKDLHTYVADFYEINHQPRQRVDYRSFDETALIAMGILLEEACKEALAENGDMVFTEPESHDLAKSRDVRSRYQIVGKVTPAKVTEYESHSEEETDTLQTQPRKRRRRHYQGSDE